MALGYYEPVDYNDPLSNLLRQEDPDDDSELDVLCSQYTAGTHRTATFQPERTEH